MQVMNIWWDVLHTLQTIVQQKTENVMGQFRWNISNTGPKNPSSARNLLDLHKPMQ